MLDSGKSKKYIADKLGISYAGIIQWSKKEWSIIMPLYEYHCDNCDHKFTVVCGMDKRNDAIDKSCPNCDKEGYIHRVYSFGSQVDAELLKADKRMEESGVQQALERIRDQHPKANMKWN